MEHNFFSKFIYNIAASAFMAIACIAIFALLYINVSAASGSNIYVATNGNDSNNGTIQKPLRTIQKAVDQASAGDTVYVRGGTYHEAVNINKSGTLQAPIKVLAYGDELPVIDGRYSLPTGIAAEPPIRAPLPQLIHEYVFAPLVKVNGNYIEFRGFKVIRSRGRGIGVAGTVSDPTHDVIISDCIVHEVRSSAIHAIFTKNVLVEGCEVYHGGNYAPFTRGSGVLGWPVIVNTISSEETTFRNNRIYESWGEGIAADRDSKNILIENNEIYDNHALQIYIHRAHDVTVQRNLVYHTNSVNFLRRGSPSQCIVLNNESQFSNSTNTESIVIKNNIVAGCLRNIAIWGSQGTGVSIENVEIANNVIVNARTNQESKKAVGINIGSDAPLKNISFHHNTIYQPYGLNSSIVTNNQISVWSNAWERTPPSNARGTNDYVGTLNLNNPNNTLVAGEVDVDWYKPRSDSALNSLGIGPDEYFSTDGPSAAPPPTSTPTQTPTPPTQTPTPASEPVLNSPGCTSSSISLVANSGFGNSGASWKHYNSEAGSFTTVPGDYRGEVTGRVHVASPGDNIQLYQSGIELEAGKTYQLSFHAYSNSGRDMDVLVHQHNSPYRALGLNINVDLSTDWQYYSYTFVPQISESDTRLRFWFADYAQADDAYFFDEVIVAKVDESCPVTEKPDDEDRQATATPEPSVDPSIIRELDAELYLPLIQ